VIRAVPFLMSVLSSVAPSFPEREAAAHTLAELGRTHRFDPVTLIAIVEGESAWRPTVISSNGRDFGLSQIRATNFRECQTATLDERQCAWRKQSLLHWKMNLTLAAGLIKANRERCKRVVGSNLASYWLQAFQGYDSTRGTTCGHRRVGKRWVAGPVPRLTRKVLKRRRELARIREGSVML
jgi:hypothetical protein